MSCKLFDGLNLQRFGQWKVKSIKLVISLVCGPESANDLLSVEDFHRSEEKTDNSLHAFYYVLNLLFYLCVHFHMLQSLQCLSYSNICVLAGDFPSALTGCRWSNLHDGPGGNTRIFAHLLCAVCSTLALGALEQNCYQTNSAMRKYESMLTRLDAVFLMTTIRWICNMAFLTNGGALTSKTNRQWGALKVLVAILGYNNWSRWYINGTQSKQQLSSVVNHLFKKLFEALII